MKKILVTGAGGAASYNFIKSLRENTSEEFYIVGTDSSKYHLELAPVDKKYILPHVSEDNYLEKLNNLINQEKINFLHAQPDTEVSFIAQNRDKIGAKTLLPDTKTLLLCQDKMELFTALRKEKIAVPESYQVTSNSLKKGLQKILTNHEKAWIRATRGAGSKAALPIKNPDHAMMWIDYWREMKGLKIEDFMISEYLPGKEYAFQSFWMNGELIVSQARERVEYLFGNIMPSGQTSTPSVAVTIHNEEVNLLATKAINTIDPHATGIFCVDLKTGDDGKVYITEINAGRFFTTSYFLTAAGINMPYIYTKFAFGEKIKKIWKQYNTIPSDLYWVRMVDMGYTLVKNHGWTSNEVT